MTHAPLQTCGHSADTFVTARSGFAVLPPQEDLEPPAAAPSSCWATCFGCGCVKRRREKQGGGDSDEFSKGALHTPSSGASEGTAPSFTLAAPRQHPTSGAPGGASDTPAASPECSGNSHRLGAPAPLSAAPSRSARAASMRLRPLASGGHQPAPPPLLSPSLTHPSGPSGRDSGGNSGRQHLFPVPPPSELGRMAASGQLLARAGWSVGGDESGSDSLLPRRGPASGPQHAQHAQPQAGDLATPRPHRHHQVWQGAPAVIATAPSSPWKAGQLLSPSSDGRPGQSSSRASVPSGASLFLLSGRSGRAASSSGTGGSRCDASSSTSWMERLWPHRSSRVAAEQVAAGLGRAAAPSALPQPAGAAAAAAAETGEALEGAAAAAQCSLARSPPWPHEPHGHRDAVRHASLLASAHALPAQQHMTPQGQRPPAKGSPRQDGAGASPRNALPLELLAHAAQEPADPLPHSQALPCSADPSEPDSIPMLRSPFFHPAASTLTSGRASPLRPGDATRRTAAAAQPQAIKQAKSVPAPALAAHASEHSRFRGLPGATPSDASCVGPREPEFNRVSRSASSPNAARHHHLGWAPPQGEEAAARKLPRASSPPPRAREAINSPRGSPHRLSRGDGGVGVERAAGRDATGAADDPAGHRSLVPRKSSVCFAAAAETINAGGADEGSSNLALLLDIRRRRRGVLQTKSSLKMTCSVREPGPSSRGRERDHHDGGGGGDDNSFFAAAEKGQGQSLDGAALAPQGQSLAGSGAPAPSLTPTPSRSGKESKASSTLASTLSALMAMRAQRAAAASPAGGLRKSGGGIGGAAGSHSSGKGTKLLMMAMSLQQHDSADGHASLPLGSAPRKSEGHGNVVETSLPEHDGSSAGPFSRSAGLDTAWVLGPAVMQQGRSWALGGDESPAPLEGGTAAAAGRPGSRLEALKLKRQHLEHQERAETSRTSG